jgi:hypothetical protein
VRTFFAPATPTGGEIAGRLFVVNRGPKGAGYLWCKRCEYAEPAPQSALLGQNVVKSAHKNPRTGEKCPVEDLSYPLDLGHIFETDVRAIGFSIPPPAFADAVSARERADKLDGFLRTLAEAVRIAAADLLEADPRDIRASKELREGRPFIVLSDSVAGGAGYVRRLFEHPRFSARELVKEAITVVDCKRQDCATSCSQCLNDYSNQTYWDAFDRRPVLDWLRGLLSELTDRPSHAPEKAVPANSFNLSGLEEQLKGAGELAVSASTIQGARDPERALPAARLIRDFCEADCTRKVILQVSSGLPLSQSPLSTLDREIADLLLRLEQSGQLEVRLAPRELLENAPRIAVRKGNSASEYYASNFDQPVFDDLIGPAVYLSASPASEDWQARNKVSLRKIAGSLAALERDTRAFRHDPGQPRDFKAMFGGIAGETVRLLIEDPYLAISDRNRGALAEFLQKLQQLNVRILSLTLSWRPARPSPGYTDERPEDQQRNLTERLKKIGIGGASLHLKPRTSRLGHFHDRVVTATVITNGAPATSFRWDITSGIDNLMERERQCSVFLMTNDPERNS